MKTMDSGGREKTVGLGRWLVAAGCLLGSATTVTAATQTLSLSPGLDIPDGNPSGTFSHVVVPAGTGLVLDVNLKMTLEGTGNGAWNGDLFVLLSHSGVASYVLNRPGRTASNLLGYGDNGFLHITFDDDVSGDAHQYQSVLGASGDSTSPITGTFQPDGRSRDPGLVLDTDSRNFLLDVFDNRPAEGPWRLLLFDLSPGGSFRLVDWELQLTYVPGDLVIPETGRGVALAGALVAGLCWYRRRTAAKDTTPAPTPAPEVRS